MGHRATRWDRWLAVGALAATIVAMAAVVLLSITYQRAIGNSGLGEWSTKGIIGVSILFGLPLVLEIGACVSRGTVGTVLRWVSAAVLGVLVLFFAFGGGIFFLPALGLMVAAAAADSTATSGSKTSDA